LLAAGQRAPVHYPESRPTFTEVECIRRVLFLARSARAAVYVVHIAAGEAVAAVRQARAEGRPVYGETCPHYHVLTKAMDARPDLHMKVQYSPYEGWDVVGMPVTTISRGKVIVNKGAFLGTPGHGRFLPRAIDPAVLHAPV